MTLVILIGYKWYNASKSKKTDKEITHTSYQSRKGEIIDNGVAVVLEEKAVHEGLKIIIIR